MLEGQEISPLSQCPSVRAYIHRIGATWVNMFVATIRGDYGDGYTQDRATIKFGKDGIVKVFPDRESLRPSNEEQDMIAEEVSAVKLPYIATMKSLPASSLPPLIANAEDKNTFIFRNMKGMIEFLQIRVDLENGDKRYVPQTYWSDGVWRAMEPEDGLPIYNCDMVTKGCRVFIHEGAKAARAAQEASENEDHPAYSFLSGSIHLGWCGGAGYEFKNRFAEIQDLPNEVVIVPDNDEAGRSSASPISRMFPTQRVQLLDIPESWPRGWDFADPIPEVVDFRKFLIPYNWATEQYEGEDGKKRYTITRRFAENWIWIGDLKRYALKNDPETGYDKEQFNQKFSVMSEVADLYGLMQRSHHRTIVDSLTFLPERQSGVITIDGRKKYNTYKDKRILAYEGDIQPFVDFMEYLIPNAVERDHLMRWITTLYSHPEIRMTHAVLLITRKHGIGKSTLMRILALLIGADHTNSPSDSDVSSQFNDWVASKRLICIHEIYHGDSFHVYNKMKQLITEEKINVNKKFMPSFELPMRAHFFAASNSSTPLKMDTKDRRWFLPTVTEQLWTEEGYTRLNGWINAGGVHHLAHYLNSRNDYVEAGENAPTSQKKMAMLANSLDAELEFIAILRDELRAGECIRYRDLSLELGRKMRDRVRFFRSDSLLTLTDITGDFVSNSGDRAKCALWLSEDDYNQAVSKYGEHYAADRCAVLPSHIEGRRNDDNERM